MTDDYDECDGRRDRLNRATIYYVASGALSFILSGYLRIK